MLQYEQEDRSLKCLDTVVGAQAMWEIFDGENFRDFPTDQ